MKISASQCYYKDILLDWRLCTTSKPSLPPSQRTFWWFKILLAHWGPQTQICYLQLIVWNMHHSYTHYIWEVAVGCKSTKTPHQVLQVVSLPFLSHGAIHHQNTYLLLVTFFCCTSQSEGSTNRIGERKSDWPRRIERIDETNRSENIYYIYLNSWSHACCISGVLCKVLKQEIV